jgi:hypothetical protein
MRRQCTRWLAVALALAWLTASAATAATWRVANNGSDSPTCGGSNAPCRTISQAILNANPGDTIIVGPGLYGDVNNDGDLLDPGEENSGVSGKMIAVGKALTIVSSDGALSTSLRTPSSLVGVSIQADGVVLGKKGKGFTIRGASGTTGIEVLSGRNSVTLMGNVVDGHPAGLGIIDGSGHQIRNNWWTSGVLQVAGSNILVRDNLFIGAGLALQSTASSVTVDRNQVERSTGIGVDLQGANHSVRRNVVAMGLSGAGFRCSGTCSNVRFQDNIARRNNGHGFEVLAGSGHVFIGNAASGNSSSGFYVNLPSPAALTFTKCTAVGNGAAGFTFPGASDNMNYASLTNCASIGNQAEGILVSGYLSVQKSSIYGNYPNGLNCGINKNSALGTVFAQQNYWGASSGPGPDPADALCGQTGQIDASSPAPSEIKVPVLRNP